MLTADTNLFIHAADPDSPHHAKAREFFRGLASQGEEFVVCELVLVELYMQLRNGAIFVKPYSTREAADYCQAMGAALITLCQEPNAEEVRFCKCRRHVLRPAHVLAQAVQEAKRQRASEVKQAIVADIEAEQALVAANRELITRFEQKIQATLARIWGEETPASPVS